MAKTSPNENVSIEKQTSLMNKVEVKPTKDISPNNTLSVFYPYISILLVFLIFSRKERYPGYMETSNTAGMDKALSIQKVIENPDIKKALQSVCMHLNEEEQTPIHTLTGLLEVISTFQNLLGNFSKTQRSSYSASSNKFEKQSGIIKVLKDHAHEEDKNLLEAVESVITAAEKIKKVMQGLKTPEIFDKERIDAHKIPALADIPEPLLSENKHYAIEEVQETIKTIEAINPPES
ncbi:hypothetical protein [Clostridium formicaceticum]|uniref:Uncharacterized protein n=1 Tax=Clostridium formicaceticum TaxID=1497 RepID=A0AAC9WHB1_9CLOT|nr:hypothetical protein [Clostridium formicaceticum]AOY77991.1 hypothetical protein BJL90_20255 [Clostridium formicaceticum]ARE88619.1 hypothetical protein CLFO_30250 [Clostridium formicaceticum]